MTAPSQPKELRSQALQALLSQNPEQKMATTLYLRAWPATFSIANQQHFETPANLPGCPERPELCSHLNIPKRSPFTPEGLAALLHAVTHIEFNAVNLALDAI